MKVSLYIATQEGHDLVVKILTEHGVDPDIIGLLVDKPLHIAALYKHEKVMKKLLNHGASVSNRDDGSSVLDLYFTPFPTNGGFSETTKILDLFGVSKYFVMDQQCVDKAIRGKSQALKDGRSYTLFLYVSWGGL
jgi:hypothetical protein